MNPNNSFIKDDKIDFIEIILTLWKEKFFILVTGFIFAVVGYIYGTLQPNVYQATITLRDAPLSAFGSYTYSSPKQFQASIVLGFNQEFKLNLLSHYRLTEFVEQNKKLDKVKSYLTENNTPLKKYFNDNIRLKEVKKIDVLNQYTFTYSDSELFSAQEFLNDYVSYIKKITETEIKKQIKNSLLNEIDNLKKNLEIAKKIDLQNPSLKLMSEGKPADNDTNELFHKGIKVLSKQIIYLEKELNQINKFNIDNNLILDKSFSSQKISNSPILIMIIAFIFGIFLSIVIIYLKLIFIKER
jgi:LPS O-antigen subunit length determinant protein (WzzB/FepE family)